MTEIEIVVFNDKSWVRLTEYQKVKEENEQLKRLFEKLKKCEDCKHSRYFSQISYALECKFTNDFCKKTCDKWELKE